MPQFRYTGQEAYFPDFGMLSPGELVTVPARAVAGVERREDFKRVSPTRGAKKDDTPPADGEAAAPADDDADTATDVK